MNSFPELKVAGPFAALAKTGIVNRAWTRFSLPLGQGEFRPGTEIAIQPAAGGPELPVQTRPLASWPDGSVRWLDCQALVGQPGQYRISMVAKAAPPVPNPVCVRQAATGGCVTLDNGLVAITLSETGPSPVNSITYAGREVAAAGVPAFEAVVVSAAGESFSTAGESARTISVRAAGPLRAIAEVRGRHVGAGGKTCLSYRLRVELTAGMPAATMRYWFFHEDAGIEEHELRQLSVRSRWFAAQPPLRHLHQTRYSMVSVPRDVATELPVDIRVCPPAPLIHVHNTECLKDENRYPAFMCDPRDSKPYAGLDLEHGAVAVWIQDFAELFPKGLEAAGNEICLFVWPPWAEPLQMHQGWSREMTMHWSFLEPPAKPSAGLAEAVAAAVNGSFTATLPPAWYAARREWYMDSVLLKGQDGADPKIDRYLSGLCQLPTVMGMWDLGDTIDPGYTSTYSYLNRLKRAPGAPPQRFLAGGKWPKRYYEENMLFNEPVWTNNEYDVILCLGRECLRGGASPELLTKLRWFARHAIEVDFVHYSDWPELHHGSPTHSVRHCTASAYPSHLWCEGLLLYYCLTGDEDALDVAVKMGDFIVNTFTNPERRRKLWHFTRELGWALLYLSCAAEISGEQRFREMAGEIAGIFLKQQRDENLHRAMVTYSFGYSSIALGMEMYHRLTGSQEIAAWLTGLAKPAAAEPQPCAAMTLNYFVAAWHVSGQRRYLDLAAAVTEIPAEFSLEDQWLHTKPVAMAYRPYSRFFSIERRQ